MWEERLRDGEERLAGGHATAAATLAAPQEALALADASLGPAEQASAHRLLGRIFLDRVDLDLARTHADRALALRRASLPDGDPALSDSVMDLAEVQIRLGDRTAAGDLLAAMPEPSDPLRRARRLELLARKAREDGAYASAFTLAEEARALRPEEADPRAAVDLYNLLGALEWFQGRMPESRMWHAQAAETARRSLGETHPAVGVSMLGQALAEFALADVEETRRLETEALAIARATRGEGHPETIDCLQNLANLHLDLAEYPQALALYEKVRSATDARFGADSDEAAHVAHNVGLLHERMGRPALARPELETAAAIWERTRGPDHPYVARALDLLATALEQSGELAAAVAVLERSAHIRDARDGNPLDLAWTLVRLGTVHQSLGRRAEARRLADRASQVCGGFLRPLAPAAVRTLALLAELEVSIGRERAGAARLEEAAAASTAVFGADHPQSARLNAAVAEALARAGRAADAFGRALEAERVQHEHLRRTLPYLAEGQALAFSARRSTALDVVLSVAGAGPSSLTARALEAAAGSRALVLDEMAARRPRPAGPSPSSLETRLDGARRRLAQVVYRESENPQKDGAARLASARDEVEALEREAAARGAAERLARQLPAPRVDALRDAVDPGSALVSYFKYRDVKSASTAAAPADRYAAFVLRPEGPVVMRPLGQARVIDEAIASWRATLERLGDAVADPGASERESRRAGTTLRQLIWDPLRPHLLGAREILIVPDGRLHLVSFPALPSAGTGYLVEQGTTFHLLSAERDLLRTPLPRMAGPLLAMGGPDFDRGVSAAGAPPEVRKPGARCGVTRADFLPQAAAEAIDVGALWKTATPEAASRVLVGREADEATFKQLAPRSAMLHLATHGFFLDGGCAGRDGPATEAAAAVSAGNPLLRSGLALAGYNAAVSALDAEDGRLTAAEVALLDLSGVRSVVLSACGSGLGPVQDGEGVLGLQRAFAIAGAGTVVMSLWPVEDAEARAWVTSFYQALLDKDVRVDTAVRESQLAALTRLRASVHAAPPALWGAWVATGHRR